MTESHSHLSYTDDLPTALGTKPAQEAMLHAVGNARLMLGSGFTSAISFGSVHRVDVYLRNAISAGQILGPRLVASGLDLGATSSNADLYPDNSQPQDYGLGLLADGPWAVRAGVRKLKKSGGDIIKLFLDGENLSQYAPPGELSYTDEEVAAACDEAHRRNMRVATHSRSAAAVKQAVRFGADVIGHANYLDDEAIDLLKKNRHRLAVGPAIAWELEFINHCEALGFSRQSVRDAGYDAEVEATVKAVKQLRAAGVRVLMGGDYGLSITPHGTYAKDLEYFVDLFGMSSAEALLCATRDGGAVADPSGMVGTLEAGKLADLVVVNGDPIADITVLQDHSRITAVMKNGSLYRGLTNDNPYLGRPEENAELLSVRAQSAQLNQQAEDIMHSAG
jgi:imidazolonepropionase-like amidohydrolase